MRHAAPILLLPLIILLSGSVIEFEDSSRKEVAAIDSSEQQTQIQAAPAEKATALYLMHGIQISKRLCYISSFCEPGEVLEQDTVQTSFLAVVTRHSSNPDSVLFDGLEGANTTPREMISEGFNGTSAAYPTCTGSSKGCGYAALNDSILEFNLSTPGGRYWGTGTLNNQILKLHTHYYYRGSGAEYILEGHKIEEEI
ncbi:MAG: hypothetical protein GVY02_09020 [Bacteroidetes bacterium]|nr:hypothetical protein [Bacteroidota bacterium]